MPIDKTCQIDNSDREYNIMKNSKLKNPELIILILSAPTNFERRKVIRETWLKLKPSDENVFKVKHYFVIGVVSLPLDSNKLISKEQIQYNDILMLPIEDSYKNLTEKMKLSFQWLDTQYDYGLGFKYVLKCDDDSFVNLNQFVLCLMNIEKEMITTKHDGYLETDITNKLISTNFQNSGPAEIAHLYWGYFNGNAKIKSKGKWKDTNWIASDRYIPYALGGGYLVSKELVSYIGRNIEHLKSFNSEDVSIGFWLSPVNGVFRIHDIRFDTEWASRGCKNNHLITHNISPVEMTQYYQNLEKTGKMCAREVTYRAYYVYNWSVPTSQCCKPSK